jgi:glycosyltransferase involved in cell wall biosynthesis
VRERKCIAGPSVQPQPQVGNGLRILAIAPTSFFADYGCHVRILKQMRLLQRSGHRIHLCTYHSGGDVPGLTVQRTWPLPWRQELEIGSSLHKIPYDFLLGSLVLRQALCLRPHLIHAYLHEGTLLALPASRLLKIPILFDFQGSLTGEMIDHHFLTPGSWTHGSLRWLERNINHSPTVITVSSHHTADSLRVDCGIAPSRIHVVSDGVDSTVFRPGLLSPNERTALLGRLGIPPGRRVVVYLGLLAEYQGISPLLEAVAYLRARRPDVHFLIMGYPRVDEYRELARRLGAGDAVTLPGRVSYDQAPRYLALGEVAVAPKLSTTEGIGKLPNYMAMALPTVAFDTPVSREYLGPAGCYAPPGDARALAERIETLLADREEAQARGLKLRQRALQLYSWEMVQEQLRGAYSQALAKGELM